MIEVTLPDDIDPDEAEIWAAAVLEVNKRHAYNELIPDNLIPEHPYKPRVIGHEVKS